MTDGGQSEPQGQQRGPQQGQQPGQGGDDSGVPEWAMPSEQVRNARPGEPSAPETERTDDARTSGAEVKD